ncbi:MAG: hypothetical protein HLUCCA13_00010 [Halomonas sp. HL-48]|nr:hypothetical protein [Halomonas sp. HL-48]KPQ26107.1 MAG: hypothetical protein HLUCCA13_00010 [Halomonas sp. HL-48]
MMHLLSELMRPVPDARVVDWLDRQDATEVAISAITVAEILYGIERLPDSRRQRSFAAMAAAMFAEDFAGRINFSGLARRSLVLSICTNSKLQLRYASAMHTPSN